MSYRLLTAGRAALVLAAVAAPFACAPPDTSQRGFGSTQVLHARDTTLSLRSFSLDESGIYLARAVPNILVTDVPVPYDRSLLTFASGLERSIAVGVVNVLQPLPSADGTGRSLVMAHFDSDQEIPQSLSTKNLPFMDVTVLDEVSGATVDIPDADSQSIRVGATRMDPFLVRRKTADEKGAFWVGPPDRLFRVPEVNQILGRDHLGLVALTTSAGGMSQSLSRIPFDGSPAVELVSGTLLNEHLTVTDPAAPTAPYAGPTTIATSGVDAAVNCPERTTANPDPRCLLVYDRQGGGMRIPFVHDVEAGTDVELPGPLTDSLIRVLRLAPTARDVFWPAIGPSTTTRLYTWHVRDTQVASCTIQGAPANLSFGVTGWRPSPPTGGGAAAIAPAQFVVVAQPMSQSAEKPATWTLIAGTAGQECHVVTQGPNLISQLSYAPDGSAIAFLENDPSNGAKVYVTDGDGGAPRLVAAGAYFFNIDFHDPRHLLLWHSNIDGYSVSWLDVSTTPAIEHPIADRARWDARGWWAWLNTRWVLLADSDSTEDGSYSLNVVDLETGERKLVSRGVRAQEAVLGRDPPPVDFRTPWFTAPAGATTLTVAYMVRARVPSSQDGLWVAHLPLSDFPP